MENDNSNAGSSEKLVVMNVNDVEHVASTVDFVFSAVDMTKKRSKRSKKNTQRQRHRSCQTTVRIVGHRTCRW